MTEPDKQETTIELEVPVGYRDDGRLDQYITGFLPNASRTKVKAGIKEGRVTVNGSVITRPAHVVQAGDQIRCTVLRPPPMRIDPEPIPLRIVFEDEALLVVDKEAGMVVHPAYGNRTGTLVHALLHHVGARPIDLESDEDEADDDVDDDGDDEVEGLSNVRSAPRFEGDIAVRPGIVHRLDKDTSGLLVVAKDDATHAALARQFMQRTTRRSYVALVWGCPEPESGRIETEVARDPRDRKRMAVVAEGKGKNAVTNYEVLEPYEHTALVGFRLETGRTHQIRVHARHLNCPIVNDRTYGGDRIARGVDTARRRAYWRNLFEAMPRQALHAKTLGFRHPGTGKQMDFEAPIPTDMQSAIDRLRRGDPGPSGA